MAVSSNLYEVSDTRNYHATKAIATKEHMAVWLRLVDDGSLPINDLWQQANILEFDLINNSAVFLESFPLTDYTHVEVRVADAPNELLNSPSAIGIIAAIEDEIKIVAGIANEVVIVAGIADEVANVGSEPLMSAVIDVSTEPLRQSILDAELNADKAQSEAWIAEAEAMTSDSYANEPFNVFVKDYFSNGDGTFSFITTAEYSSVHWATQAKYIAAGLEYMGTWDASTGAYPPDGTINGQFYIVNVSGVIDPNGTPVKYAVGDWMVWNNDLLEWAQVAWTFDWTSITNVPQNVVTAVGSNTTLYGGDRVVNVVRMTRPQYDNITPAQDAMYVIIG